MNEFVETIRQLHKALHGNLPCGCTIGKAFEKLEGKNEPTSTSERAAS